MQRTGWAWRRAVTTMVAASLLMLGACTSGDPTDVPTTSTPTVDSTPTPTSSPTVDLTKLPERPAAMDEPTTDGAIAAATYALELYGYSFATADLGPWRALTADTCQLCASVERGVDEMVAAGESSTGSVVTVLSATSTEISNDEWFSVEMRVVQGPSQRMDADGEVVAEGVGGEYDAVFALSWSTGWSLDEMGLELSAESATEG